MRRLRPVTAALLGFAAFGLGAILWKTGAVSLVARPAGGAVRAVSGWAYGLGSRMRGAASRVAKADAAGLIAENESLRAESARLKSLLAENLALRTALDYREGSAGSYVTSRVVSAAGSDAERMLVIDAGSSAGVGEDQAVLTPAGTVIGKVFAVQDETASVMLLTDSRSRLAVAILTEPEISGILEGERGTAAAVSLIPDGTDIPPGTAVVTAGLEPGIPRGLAVGSVGRTEQGGQEPFQKAFLTGATLPPLSFVQVRLPPPGSER